MPNALIQSSLSIGTTPVGGVGLNPVAQSTRAQSIILDLRGGWNGGTLKIKMASHSAKGDHLTLPPTSSLWLNTKNLVLMSGLMPIGVASHPSVYHCDEWIFTFNQHATTRLVQRTAQAVVFSRQSDTTDHAQRNVTFVATNAAGTFAATQTVPSSTMDGSTPVPSHRNVAVLDGINDYLDVQGYRF